MNKKKLLGIGIAVAGTSLSVSLAAALYQKNATPTTFSFGSFTYIAETGDIDYKIANAITTYSANGTVDDTTHFVNPSNTAVWVKAPISASYPSEGNTVGQATIGGNISVTVTLSDSLAAAGVTMETAATINGYAANTYYTKGHNSVFGSNQTLSSSKKSHTANINIGVSTVASNANPTLANNQYLEVYMNFTGLTDSNMLTLGGGAAYTISVTWGSRNDAPHIVGDANNFDTVDEFAMVPVINENIEFEKWSFIGLTGFTSMKIKDGEKWVGTTAEAYKDSYNNVVITSGDSYNVYYKHTNNDNDLVRETVDQTNYIKNC